MSTSTIRAMLLAGVGVAFLGVGVVQVARGSRPADMAWFVVIFMAFEYWALRRYSRGKAQLRRTESDEVLRAHAQKRVRTTGTVTGKTCVECKRRIVIEHDGQRCENCSEPVHRGCERQHVASTHKQSDGSAYR